MINYRNQNKSFLNKSFVSVIIKNFIFSLRLRHFQIFHDTEKNERALTAIFIC